MAGVLGRVSARVAQDAGNIVRDFATLTTAGKIVPWPTDTALIPKLLGVHAKNVIVS